VLVVIVVVVEPVSTLGVEGPPQAATATPTAKIPAVIKAAWCDRRRLGLRWVACDEPLFREI
jgi:hypothetical protein